jgi:LAO/AO transport system kinase
VAVLAIDPSSSLSGGSILGDKTRMTRLSNDPAAFVRPSPSGGELGGVARKTLETLLLCEAAGFDVVLVETVGVGQSETAVSELVDCVVTLLLAGAGDELQGIKRGIMELSDIIVINKADGDNAHAADAAAREHRSALRYLRHRHAPTWTPQVLTASGERGLGLDTLWHAVRDHREALASAGALEALRSAQQVRWMWRMVEAEVMQAFRGHPAVAALLDPTEGSVRAGRTPPTAAALGLLRAFGLKR